MTSVDVQDVPERHRYEARVDGDLLGVAAYQRRDDVVVLTHTEVEPAAEGTGASISHCSGGSARATSRT